jgi:hypothetical protein
VALARMYNVDAQLATGIFIGSGGVLGTEYVLMYGQTSSTSEYNISAVRVATYSAATATYPSNGTITFRIRRVSGAAMSILQSTASVNPVSQSTTPANSTWIYATSSGSGTATVATYGAILWSQTLPATAGANWGEWFTPGFELNCPVSGTLAVTYMLGSAGTTLNVGLVPELVISE